MSNAEGEGADLRAGERGGLSDADLRAGERGGLSDARPAVP